MGSTGANRGSSTEERALAAISSRREVTRENPITAEEMLTEMTAQERGSVAAADQEKLLKRIDRVSFKSEGAGTGHWTMELEGVGGASILDETESSAGGYGRYKTYSVQTWGADFKDIGRTEYAPTLNDAKELARRKLRGSVM